MKTIIEQVNEIEDMANKLQIKLAEDEADRQELEKLFNYYQDGKLDKEVYDEIEKEYRATALTRWA
jgi:hypothetical protein